VLATNAPRTTDATELVSVCRVALGHSIVQQIFGQQTELQVMVLDPEIERMLLAALATSGNEAGVVIEPGLAEALFRNVAKQSETDEQSGYASVLLVPDRLRSPLARMCKRVASRLRVLAHSEIPDNRVIKVNSVVGANS